MGSTAILAHAGPTPMLATYSRVPGPNVVPPESWRASLCGFPVGGRGVLVFDQAHHRSGAVPAVVVVEAVAPVEHDGLGLAGGGEFVAGGDPPPPGSRKNPPARACGSTTPPPPPPPR